MRGKHPKKEWAGGIVSTRAGGPAALDWAQDRTPC
jgi:hypothetical protein